MNGVRGLSAEVGKALRRSVRGPSGWLSSVDQWDLTKRLFVRVLEAFYP
jgi:hypothetical protein